MQEISLITPYNLRTPYSYLAPKNLNLNVGDIVLITVRNKETYGIVVRPTLNNYKKNLKHIIKKIDQIKLAPYLVDFITWSAEYNIINIGALLKMVFPFSDFIYPDFFNTIEQVYTCNTHQSLPSNLTTKQQVVFNFFVQQKIVSNELIKKHKISKSIINKLIGYRLIQKTKNIVTIKNNKQENIYINLPITLNNNQDEIYKRITHVINNNKFSVSLLDGVPGSGKTEVYFKLISEVLKKNQTVLVLLPEIALSVQWLSRFKKNFGVESFVWHSNISRKEKKTTFISILNDEVKVIVGTRSALFLPFKNLGLIIIDEEHDSSFKQEEKIVYNARDLAITRGYFKNIPVILTTATPSLETWYNAKVGKYNYFQLNTRFNNSSLPKIHIVDTTIKNYSKEYISQYLLDKLTKNIHNNEQSLLFLNKRGYANITQCKECKKDIFCPKCSHETEKICLVEHKSINKLICHRCGYRQIKPKICECCGKANSLISVGCGIEKLAEEVQHKIPYAKIVLASSDLINNTVKASNLVKDIINKKVDIIIGTQILAKGYHFPNLSLVGVIDVGMSGYVIDLKTNERIWQLLYQVAGRAGREKTKGEVIIQSDPNNFLIQTLIKFQRNEFLNQELVERSEDKMPPFTRLAAIIISSPNEKKLDLFIYELKSIIFKLTKEYQNCIKGPVPAAFFRVNKKFRYRLLITTEKNIKIQNIVNEILNQIKPSSDIHIKVDIDPINFY